MTDDQLEEAMLAILVFTASLKNRHAQFVEEKNQRTQTKINDARAEKDRLDAELRDLRSREQELEQAREAAETKLALLQQSIAS
jgi:chromosome segregation ATPase